MNGDRRFLNVAARSMTATVKELRAVPQGTAMASYQ
jgi:hypothetical protein